MSTAEKVAKKARKAAVTAASHKFVTEGFSTAAARRWVRSQIRDLQSAGDINAAINVRNIHESGHTVNSASVVGTSANLLSYKDYLYLSPLNRRRAWLTNLVTAYRFVDGFEKYMPTPICTVFTYREVFDIVRLHDFPADALADETGLLAVIRQFGQVNVRPVRWDRGRGRQVAFDGQGYTIDGWPASEEDVLGTLRKMSSIARCVLLPVFEAQAYMGESLGFDDAVLRLFIGRGEDNKAHVLQGQLCVGDRWRAVEPTLEEIGSSQNEGIRRGWGKRRQRMSLGEQRFDHEINVDLENGDFQKLDGGVSSVPQLTGINSALEEVLSSERHEFTFISVDVVLGPDGTLEIRDLSISPRFPATGGFNNAVTEFLTTVMDTRRDSNIERGQRQTVSARVTRRTQRVSRRYAAFQLRAKGFTGRAARLWVRRSSAIDRKNSGNLTSLDRQALDWGFDPAYAGRFGITDANRNEFVSLRDYLYVQPLNGKYAKWVRDRVSTHSVFKPYLDSFEILHYQVLRRDRELQVIALSDEARAFGSDINGVAKFLVENDVLTLSSSAWSGTASEEVTYESGRFVINGVPFTSDEFEKLLTYRVREQFYVLGEKKIDSSSLTDLSTIGNVALSITMMNPSGIAPAVAEASVVSIEDAEHVEAFLKNGHVLGRQTKSSRLASAAVSDEQLIEMQLAGADQRADGDDPGPGFNGDDITVEDDAVEKIAHLRLVSRVTPETGRIEAARSLVRGRLYVYKNHPVSETAIAREVPQWNEIVKRLQELCIFAPQLRFVEFSVVLAETGPVINGVSATPTYGQEYSFSPATVKFLLHELEEKEAKSTPTKTVVTKWLHQTKLKTRREFANALYPKGLVPYQSVRWLGDMRRDLFERNKISLRTKFWAYKNGFLSYRIPQYGITEENREQFISDFEYRWLRHINKKYKYWLEDKVSIKYVAAQFNDCLPAYYFYTTAHEGKNTVVPMMDCPEGFSASFESVIRLAKDKQVLALKPDEGSHGDGFFRLEWTGSELLLNGETSTENDVLQILKDTKNQYLVTEFIQMHPVLARIYPHSVNTIRLIVFKKDGVTPQIGNAYLRIGSLKSGYVDNTAAGGMLAQIDPATGRFGDAKILDNGRIADCPRHPDTDVEIDGVIPHWDYAVKKVLDIAASLPQLEYLGFDLAITPTGIMLPEINRSPDFPRIDRLTPETIEYLLYKLDKKKRMFGYDVVPPRKLFSLPSRKD
ncbi:hypothetical protein CIK76_17140 [Glutamicibacter sp. BW80]|uniref:sugar-transfer associated ATP-grasp domain-containing protein n=1 Tax=Glutamicibacter sp. BW80 TaxID=2024404 RepID=UPI000BB774BD|nr:sugar-transfer associated ATP-grasp domain-containing protein [Glutamicibacter sp. BW80]PCC27472.1 hypothetical protein CIK76_17140 [Glutamicibacter sp. BW80]